MITKIGDDNDDSSNDDDAYVPRFVHSKGNVNNSVDVVPNGL